MRIATYIAYRHGAGNQNRIRPGCVISNYTALRPAKRFFFFPEEGGGVPGRGDGGEALSTRTDDWITPEVFRYIIGMEKPKHASMSS